MQQGAGCGVAVIKGSAQLWYKQQPAAHGLPLAKYLQAAVGDFFEARPRYVPRQAALYLAFFADVLGVLHAVDVNAKRRTEASGTAPGARWPNPDGRLSDTHIGALRAQLVRQRSRKRYLGRAIRRLRRSLGAGSDAVV